MLYIIDLYEERDFYADNIYTVYLYLYILFLLHLYFTKQQPDIVCVLYLLNVSMQHTWTLPCNKQIPYLS